MANTKISQLTALSNPTWSEELVYAFNNANGKMTLNTMKTFIQPDLSWYQEKLVNQSNIKSINWESLLWSWNIIVSWWWGGGGADMWYQAVVDASGNADYTTITAALADWNRSILVLPWTYNETEWNNITDSWVVIHWVDEERTIINVTLDTSDTYPYFIKHTWTTIGNVIDDIRNLTFNVTYKKTWYLVDWYTTDTWKSVDVTIENCTFNVTSLADVWAYILRVFNGNATKWLFNNLNVNITDSWHYISVNTDYVWQFNNCAFYLKATWSRVALSWSSFNNCSILWEASDSWWTYTSLDDIVNCNIEIYGNNAIRKWRMYINDAKNSNIELSYWAHPSTDISWSTAISDWAESTSYSVWDYVWLDWDLLECIEAHTSQGTPWQDEEKWDYVTALRFHWNVEWCRINLWSWSSNTIISLYWGTNSYLPYRFENNHIGNAKIFSWWYLIINWNEITTNFLQNRWWASVITWNRFFSSNGWCTLYYADNYSLIENNIVAWQNSSWAISILWTSTNTSKVDNNLLLDARNIS